MELCLWIIWNRWTARGGDRGDFAPRHALDFTFTPGPPPPPTSTPHPQPPHIIAHPWHVLGKRYVPRKSVVVVVVEEEEEEEEENFIQCRRRMWYKVIHSSKHG